MNSKLTRREQQAMDVIHRDAPCSAQNICDALEISYSAARAILTRLVEKNVLRHEYDGPRYVFLPVTDSQAAGTSALQDIVSTLFRGSAAEAMGALLAMSGDGPAGDRISDRELEALEQKVRLARAERRD